MQSDEMFPLPFSIKETEIQTKNKILKSSTRAGAKMNFKSQSLSFILFNTQLIIMEKCYSEYKLWGKMTV